MLILACDSWLFVMMKMDWTDLSFVSHKIWEIQLQYKILDALVIKSSCHSGKSIKVGHTAINLEKVVLFSYIMKGLKNRITCLACDNKLKCAYSSDKLIETNNKNIPNSQINIFDKRSPQFVVPKDHNYMRCSSHMEISYFH